MVEVQHRVRNTTRFIGLSSFKVRSDFAGQMADVFIFVECPNLPGEVQTVASIKGFRENGPSCPQGDKPFRHVEFYGSITDTAYDVGYTHYSPDGLTYASGTFTYFGRSYTRLYHSIKSGDSIGVIGYPISYETMPIEIDGDTFILRYRVMRDGKPISGWYDLPTRISDCWVLNEKPNEEVLLLPWQFTLKPAYFDSAWSCAARDEQVAPHWGDLCQSAVDGTKAVNINTMMYCKELLEMGSMVKSTFESVKDLTKNPIKQASNLYLSYHYGYRLSVKDTVELYSAAKREFNSVKRVLAATRARKEWQYQYPSWTPLGGLTAKRERCVKVWYRQMDDGLEGLLTNLFRWDVFPELGNVYDYIPYSFVVDWLLPFGDILDKIDYHTYSHVLRVLNTVRSESFEVSSVPMDSPLLLGLIRGYSAPSGLTLKLYQRWIERDLTYPPLQLTAQAGPSNWLPAGALILQRI